MLNKYIGSIFDLNPRRQEDSGIIAKMIYASENNTLFGFKILQVGKWTSKTEYIPNEIFFFTIQNLPVLKLLKIKQKNE